MTEGGEHITGGAKMAEGGEHITGGANKAGGAKMAKGGEEITGGAGDSSEDDKGRGNDGGVEMNGSEIEGVDVVDVDASVDGSNGCSESFARFGLPV